MRAAILTLLLVGCAAPAPSVPPLVIVSAEPEACPPLPTLPRRAGRKAMLAHIDTTAQMYADCATRER
jgi:hypothetical protein